jgi:hypothetical protein
LKKDLKWIRYLIKKKYRFVTKITLCIYIFKVFFFKLGFWQIQFHPKDRYKTAFAVPFGQYEWNVMPFGLKNALSSFQRIMNDIFNSYSKFCIL